MILNNSKDKLPNIELLVSLTPVCGGNSSISDPLYRIGVITSSSFSPVVISSLLAFIIITSEFTLFVTSTIELSIPT